MTIEVQRWEDKFEIKPGVWVYVPSVEARKVGGKILQAVRNKWIPPLYFYHLRTGGHLKAARLHLINDELEQASNVMGVQMVRFTERN